MAVLDVIIKKSRTYQHIDGSLQLLVMIIEDMKYPYYISGFWEKNNTTYYKCFGLLENLANGDVRDLDYF